MSSKTKLTAGILGAMLIVSVGIIWSVLTASNSNSYKSELNVLNWTSYIPNEIIRDFEKEYKIKVNYNTYSSNEELLAKITSANAGIYDVIFPSDYMVKLMSKRDLLEKIDLQRLPNLQNLDQRFLHQEYDPDNAYSLPFLLATTVIAYDSVKYPNVDSYRDLFGEEFENSLILVDDQRIIIGAMLNTLGYSINDTDNAHLEESLALFNTLRPNIKAFDSDSPKTFLITEEADAGIVWNAEAILAKESRPEINLVYPKEGFVLSMDNYCIARESKNLDNAYIFINYLMRNEVAKKIAETYPYISPSTEVNVLSNDEIEYIFTNGTYIQNVGNNIKKFDKLWAKYK